jgi:hypothetical protein
MLSASAPTLMDLTIEYSGPAGDDYTEWPKDPIEFPALQEFKIGFLPPIYCQNLLLTIDAPRLESLHIDLEEGEDDSMDDWNRIVEILCTSGYLKVGSDRCRSNRKRGPPLFPTIRRCNISALPVDTINLGILLFYHPQISELTLNFNYLSDELLPALAEPLRKIPRQYNIMVPKYVEQPLKGILDGSTYGVADQTRLWLVPLLKTFRVYGIDGSALRLLTKNRMEGSVPLHAIYYSDGTSIKTSDRMWLTEHLDHFEEFIDSDDDDDDDDEEEDEENGGDEDADVEGSDTTADGDTEDED